MKLKRKFLSCLFLCCLAACFCTGCKKTTFPTNEYPNGQLLVSGDFLESILDTQGLVIIDARSAGYEEGHIPGAVNLKWTDFVDNSTMLLSVADISKKLGTAGISRNKTYVIYDNTLKAWGAAGRIFWMLEYMGCSDVHILNGGWDLWTAKNRGTETTKNTLPATIFIPAVKKNQIATKDHIAARLDDDDFVIIDSRTDEEFNGWQLYGETRGGHIPGAVQIPYEWFFENDNKTVLAYKDLKDLLYNQGISTDKEVTAYCTAGIRSGFIYFTLRLMGYTNCSNYANSMYEWSADPALQMDKLPNYEKLVSAEWVNDLIKGKKVANPPAGRHLIVGAFNRGTTDILIPGSILSYKDEWEAPSSVIAPGAGSLWPDAQWKANIEAMGIDKDTTVIVYFAATNNNHIVAARLLWGLMYAGVKDVRMLNGGIDTWLAKGFDIVATPAERVPVEFDNTTNFFPLHPDYLATNEYVEEVVDDKHSDAVLADIRCWTEYIGGPNDYASINIPLTVQGRIAGARWGHWGPKTLVGGDFWDNDHTLRSYPQVEKIWKDWGITSEKTVSYYCGTGWRSSLAFFYGYLMGWKNVKNYDDSFFGWSTTHANAATHKIETGVPSDAPENPTAE